MADREKIISTFKRIEKSLNLRFEKKGSLFIDKKDLEDLKRSISNGEMQNIQAMETKIDSAIITQVILKNPWLISDSFLNTKDFSSFLRINIAKNNNIYLLKNIIDDNVYTTNIFKAFIEEIYYPLIKLSECKNIVRNMTLKPSVILICFKRIMIGSTESGIYKIREINDFLNDNQELYKTVKNQPSYLNDIMITLDDKDDVAEWILDNKITGKKEQIWLNAFTSLKIDALNASVNYIENNLDYDDYETNKWLFQKVFPKLFISASKDTALIEDYSTKILNLYKHRDAYKIKVLFLRMLEPHRFRNKEIAHTLLDEFESIGIADKFYDDVEKIRSWGADASRGYASYDDLFQNLFSQNANLTLKGTLDYFSREFNKTKYSVIEELYSKNKYDENTLKIISYHIAVEMNRQSTKLMKVLKPLPDEYIDTIIEFISEYNINSDTTRAFLHANNRRDILEKFMER
jgi:hypothetical protein